MAVTLEMVLASRDERSLLQRRMLASAPGLALVVATVVVPGPGKRTEVTLRIAGAMDRALRQAFDGLVREEVSRDLPTGYEGFFLVDTTCAEAKRLAVRVEETHPLGRLFDIDVIGPDGVPLSRTGSGGAPRRCLLCGDNARICMRERKHSIDELTDYIRSLTDEYFGRIRDSHDTP